MQYVPPGDHLLNNRIFTLKEEQKYPTSNVLELGSYLEIANQVEISFKENSIVPSNFEKAINKMKGEWLVLNGKFDGFHEHYKQPLNLNECLLLTLWQAKAASDNRYRTSYSVRILRNLYFRLVIMATQHSPSRWNYFPSEQEVGALEAEVSSYVLEHIGWSGFTNVAIITEREMKDQGFHYETYFPIALNVQQEYKICTEKIDMSAQQIGNRGKLFQDTLELTLRGLIPLANRVFSQIEMERLLLKSYPVNTEFAKTITVSQRDVFLAWFAEQNKRQPGELLINTFTNLVFELMLPMGAHSLCLTSDLTKDEKSSADEMLQISLGVDLAQYNKDLTENLAEVLKGSNIIHYECLILAQFAFMIWSKGRVKLLDLHFIYPWQYFRKFERFAEKGVPTSVMEKRRPIVTFLTRKWMIHFDDKWYIFNDVIDLILGYVMIMLKEFKGVYTDGFQLDKFCHTFIPAE